MLLLRVSVLSSFAAIAIGHPIVASNPVALAAIALVSLCLGVGLGTPVVSAIAGVAAVADMLVGSHWQDFSVRCVLLLDAAALGVLGPGAYSVDARRFGRRVTVLPAPPKTDG